MSGHVGVTRVVLLGFVSLGLVALPAQGQTSLRVDSRLGYLVTGGDTFSDRPFVQIGGALELGRARAGAAPVLAVSVGLVAEFGDIFAASMTTSWRMLAGLEAAWVLAEGPDGGAPRAEFVPSIQAGYQTTVGQDERSGLTLRAGPGLRIPIASDGGMLLTFEPVSVVLLPAPDGPIADEARIAWELGILKLGFRF
ncbi:MAG: hypothetical protein ACE5FP_10470 [Gemmatimonadota bacterium]